MDFYFKLAELNHQLDDGPNSICKEGELLGLMMPKVQCETVYHAGPQRADQKAAIQNVEDHVKSKLDSLQKHVDEMVE